MNQESCELIELHNFLGKKWVIVLIHNITNTPISFNDLRRISKGKISSILLSSRLKEMVKFKLIKKETIDGRIVYSVTNEGIELKEIMHKLKAWSIKSNYKLPKVCTENKCYCRAIFEE